MEEREKLSLGFNAEHKVAFAVTNLKKNLKSYPAPFSFCDLLQTTMWNAA
jgi:hypothetical protein